MINGDKPYSLIGLAYKGGNLVAGTEMCRKAVVGGRAKLVLLSEDCSENTKKLFLDKCSYRRVPVSTFGTKDKLGRAVGKTQRSVVAFLDEGFSGEVLKLIDA